jgi:hypothetical protein
VLDLRREVGVITAPAMNQDDGRLAHPFVSS